MINSMTGYGEAEGEVNGVTYAVEVKTVNNRYFKTTIKLPETAAFLEEDIERLLRQSLSRGTVSYVLRLKNVPANVLFDIDETALRGYMERLGRIGASVDINRVIDIGGLVYLPGILTPVLPDDKAAGKIREAVLGITRKALEKLKQMRAAEGAALAADLDCHCRAMRQDLEQIRSRNGIVLQEYRNRLKKRVDELLAEVKLELDEETLAREVAVFAERSDISEELARLESHLEQFDQSCQASEQAGRRLDFISQEMLREANTIASKASDSQIVRWVLDMKCRIDRIKEQVQNVE
ncbi:MAG TPA: YicC/YloC family endoribonuclease [Sedimentisphaerales bacterium]|nr:YicC/YloC family endoribonuclease [Sedimentisphaerales bacterium]